MKQNLRKRLSTVLVMMLAVVASATAQAVRGTVVDGSNEPMIGVTVMEKGTQNATVTDFDGNFSLQVKPGKMLVFTYIGFEPVEMKAASRLMRVIMKEDAKVLEDVVVVGYGVQKKASVTGAISQVKAEDLENRTITDAASALQGKTSGVQVINSSARPGASPTIRIRGYSSNVSSDPLYVVDGVRMKSISGIDPNDIASMEILKDAASAAIYGAEAGNGVVLISLKKGKKGEGKISYDFQLASQSLSHAPASLNAEEYIDYMTEAGAFSRDYLLKNWDGTTNTDWMKESFENSLMTRHNLAFTGGNERGNFYASLSYLNNNGIVKGDADIYKRLTGSVNAEYKIKDWLKVGTTNQIEKYNVRSVGENNEYGSYFMGVMIMDPLTPWTYTPDQLPYSMAAAQASGKTLLTDEDGNYYSSPTFYNGESYHPMVMRDRNISRSSGFNVSGSAYAEFTPIKDLVYTSRFGYRLTGTRSSSVDLPFYGNAVQSNDYVGMSSTSSTTIYYQWENFINYTKKIKDHTIGAMAGMSYQEQTYDYVGGSLSPNGEDALTVNSPLFYYLDYGSASATKGVSGEKTRTAKYSYFGRLTYDYQNRYMVQFSLRADAADLSFLSKTKRWGYFPAVSVGWVVSEEKFFQPLRKVVTNLKLRGGWGQNGSLSALSGYQYSTDMSQVGLYAFVSGNAYTQGVRPSSMGNDELKWETSEQLNIGLDSYFFDGRLNFTVEWFNKKTKDLLIYNTTPSLEIGGTTSPLNAGNVSNKGFEFELGWNDHVKDFRYGIRANLATLSNEVTYIDPSITRLSGATFHTYTMTYFEQGYPVYYFRGYKFKGIDPETGNPTFYDLDGSGTLNDGDLTNIGDAIPDFTYGLTLTAGWKGLDLTVFGTGSYGNKVWNCINRPDFISANKMKEFFYDNRWTPSNTSGTVPRAGAADMDKYAVSDAMVFDGSYFKIKQIQLGYTLPQNLTKKASISHLRVYASLDDWFLLTSYKGFDPEVSSNATSGMGLDKGTYPTSKKIVLGFNVEF